MRGTDGQLTPTWQSRCGTASLYLGDALGVLRTLPAESVNCCVTSPPYWGLRDYGLPATVWGGEPDCAHEWNDASWRPSRWGNHDDDNPGEKQQTNGGSLGHRGAVKQQSVCSKCGAWLGCLGLEPTPELFAEHTVDVFREVRRVLADDGVLFMNMGDSYSTDTKWGGSSSNKNEAKQGYAGRHVRTQSGCKPKDLVGIPWLLAFALRADGWWLRSEIIWAKPNGMPGSQEDRVTSSHETIFMLTKSATYWSDFDAIKTPPRESTLVRLAQDVQAQAGSHRANGGAKTNGTNKQRGHSRRHAGFNERWDQMEKSEQQAKPAMMRDVWFVSPAQSKDAHFAVMPAEIARRCILAGCPEGGTVLDPFNGSGTTGQVALENWRRYIGIDINPAYVNGLSVRRIESVTTAHPLFAEPQVQQELI